MFRNQLILISLGETGRDAGICVCEDCCKLYKASGILVRLSRQNEVLYDPFDDIVDENIADYILPLSDYRRESESFADWVERICMLPQ